MYLLVCKNGLLCVTNSVLAVKHSFNLCLNLYLILQKGLNQWTFQASEIRGVR